MLHKWHAGIYFIIYHSLDLNISSPLSLLHTKEPKAEIGRRCRDERMMAYSSLIVMGLQLVWCSGVAELTELKADSTLP